MTNPTSISWFLGSVSVDSWYPFSLSFSLPRRRKKEWNQALQIKDTFITATYEKAQKNKMGSLTKLARGT